MGKIYNERTRQWDDDLVYSVPDPVNDPKHYQNGGIETIEIIQAMLTPEEFNGYLKGSVIKYRERANYKGNTEQDFAKAKWYWDKLKGE